MSIVTKQLQVKDKQLDYKLPVAVESKIDRLSHTQTPFFSYPPPYRRDYYVCTGCGTYSCGGVYSSTCPKCDGITRDPPDNIRRNYLCTICARRRPVCTCDRPTTRSPTPTPPLPPPPPIYRLPAKYCWCECCKCCTYTCSCLYCDFFCECLSSPCKSKHHEREPCCYCTRKCCPNQVCCKTRYCFWSWCPCSCSQPEPYP